jgi:hypothetical protein
MSFAMRTIGDIAAGYTGVMVSLGSKLGLYKALAGAGPLERGRGRSPGRAAPGAMCRNGSTPRRRPATWPTTA